MFYADHEARLQLVDERQAKLNRDGAYATTTWLHVGRRRLRPARLLPGPELHRKIFGRRAVLLDTRRDAHSAST